MTVSDTIKTPHTYLLPTLDNLNKSKVAGEVRPETKNMEFHLPPSKELEHLPLFCYGTLRTEGSLHQLIKPYILKGPLTASTKGTLALSNVGDWPLLLDGQIDVVGEIFIIKINLESLKVLLFEELSWGYSLIWRDFHTAEFKGKALVCHWPWELGFDQIIDSSDWIKFIKTR